MNRKYTAVLIKVNGTIKEYKGRFLGVIKDDEFNALMNSPDMIAPKLLTKEAQSVVDLSSDIHPKGKRFVFAVKKIEDKDVAKALLVTGKIDMITYVNPNRRVVVVNFESSNDLCNVREVCTV
jgi:hypothetical protein